MLCHGTVCVVGKMRDLILQLSKSSIYSTKPFLLYTWPFFLALMPVAVVVGIALHSLLNGKLLYSASATILTVGLMFALLFLWLLG
ncbi:DUF3561 family protein [Klebsiella quasipneumoniae subsp. similipneumoniae]